MKESSAMRNMQEILTLRLVKIEDEFRRLGLTAISNLTLIARDPANDRMFVCLTNEDKAGLEKACSLAMNHVNQQSGE